MTATLPDNLKPHSTDCNATGADPATPREEARASWFEPRSSQREQEAPPPVDEGFNPLNWCVTRW